MIRLSLSCTAVGGELTSEFARELLILQLGHNTGWWYGWASYAQRLVVIALWYLLMLEFTRELPILCFGRSVDGADPAEPLMHSG